MSITMIYASSTVEIRTTTIIMKINETITACSNFFNKRVTIRKRSLFLAAIASVYQGTIHRAKPSAFCSNLRDTLPVNMLFASSPCGP